LNGEIYASDRTEGATTTKAATLAIVAAICALMGTATRAKEAFESWPAGASVKIESPKDGEALGGYAVKFVLSAKGAKLVPKGCKAKAGDGYFYLSMDEEPIPLGHAVSGTSSQRQVLSNTETTVNIPADLETHSFLLQFVDCDNRSHGPKASCVLRNIKGTPGK
jgi:hypothetical protein